MRDVADLRNVEDPAWPRIAAQVESSGGRAEVLTADGIVAERCLYRLQVTVRSALGALALNTGGIAVDHRWLLLLGGGHPPLPDLAAVNGLTGQSGPPPPLLEVGRDVLGGVFAVNGGGLPGAAGNVHYFAPDSLDWEDLGLGHGAFVGWALTGDIETFYAPFRWPGWEREVAIVPLDQGLSIYPPLFTAERKDMAGTSRAAVPWHELRSFHDEMQRHVRDLPPGASFRIRPTP